MRDLYRDALAPYVVTDDQIDELVQLVRKHIDARGHFTGSDLDQQIYNYLLSAKRHAKTNARGEIKNIYRYLLPIIENNDIGWWLCGYSFVQTRQYRILDRNVFRTFSEFHGDLSGILFSP